MATTVGIQAFDGSGALLFDSRTAVGGVGGDYREYAAGFSGETISYPQWAGYSAILLLDMSPGYPVVTVGGSSSARTFSLLVY
jgi:hypothetical protein